MTVGHSMFCLVGLCAAVLASGADAQPVNAQGGALPVVLVLPRDARQGVSADTAALVTELLVARVRHQPGLQVKSYRDVESAMTLEMRRMLVDCDEVSCAAEIAGALNADQVVMGTVGQVGTSYVLSITRIRQGDLTVLGHYARQFEGQGDERISQEIPTVVAELFGPGPQQVASGTVPIQVTVVAPPAPVAPVEEPPSPVWRVVVWGVRGTGSVVAGVGALLGAAGVVTAAAGGLLVALYINGNNQGDPRDPGRSRTLVAQGQLGSLMLALGLAVTAVATAVAVAGLVGVGLSVALEGV